MIQDNPVYVAGIERSGTSLMYALLASHPHIAMSRRANLWTHFYDQFGDLSVRENFEHCLAMLVRYKRMVPLELDPARLRREFQEVEPTYANLFALIEGHYAERAGKQRWGDKSLHTERYAEPIFKAFPDARILHMLRDPRDRYASALKRWKVSRAGVGGGTALWLSSVKLAKHNQQRFPDRYKIVRYESLVSDPEEVLHEICAFIDEPYSPAMLSMRGARMFRDEGGNSSYGQLEPGRISTKPIGRYHKMLSARQVAFMQLFAGEEMKEFAYEPEQLQLSVIDKAAFLIFDLPFNLARMFAWYAREAFLNWKGRPVPSYRIIEPADHLVAETMPISE